MNSPIKLVDLANSEQCRDRTATELEYVKMNFNDVNATITEDKAQQWQIVRWVATIDVAAVGLAYVPNVTLPKLMFGLIVIFAGAIGITNFAAVQRDLNHHRRTLLSLRRFMGGFAYDLHEESTGHYMKGSWRLDVRNNQLAIIIFASFFGALTIIYR